MGGYLYIPASKRNGTLYTGITADLGRRVIQYKEGNAPGFTKKYMVEHPSSCVLRPRSSFPQVLRVSP